MSRRAQRGQGTVELALSTLVFVTILLAGIQFAEIGFLSLKVQEASNFAVWRATTERVHKAGEPNYTAKALPQVVKNKTAQNRYSDFTADEKTGKAISQVIIRGTDLGVTCEEVPDVRFRIDEGSTPAEPMLDTTYATRRGGIACSATAKLSLLKNRNPDEFAQRDAQGGFFTQLNNKMGDALTVCSFGRPNGGTCQGRYPILIGDWGLIGEAEGAEIPNSSKSANPVYFTATENVYGAAGGSGSNGATLFAQKYGGGTPGDIGFNISFIPWQEGMQGKPDHGGLGSSFYTDGIDPAQHGRGNCYFGLACP